MEFDEIKKIWDAQNNQPLYAIDEKTLHKRVQSKMKGALRYANISEWMIIIAYFSAGGLLIVLDSLQHRVNIFMYIEAAWMLATVVYVLAHRCRRISANRRFDRSIHGDLDHAISIATYHLRLARIMNWNLLPLGALMFFTGWEAGKLLKIGAVILVAYSLAFYAGVKGNRVNIRRRRELQVLKEKLESGY
jgi:hypothetical protein